MSDVATSAPTAVWPLAGPLLEGPVWTARDQRLWFVEIKRGTVHCFDPEAGDRRSWDAPGQVGFVLPASGGRFIAGLQSGLAIFDPADSSFTPLLDPEPDRPGNRLNDATLDAAGRLWFGTMDDAERAATGRIYRYDGNDLLAATPPVAITNGPAISPDGRTLYHVDTLAGTIHACTLGDDGLPRDTRVFATIDSADGYPDGPAVDAEGCLWVGLYNGWAVRRYSPEGALLEVVRFPVSAITKVAFGGPDLRTVYATTARKHLDDDAVRNEPLAGALFAFRAAVPGLPAGEANWI